MELEITTVKENPLMDRREVRAEVKHQEESTPSEEDVLNRITADRGLEKDNVEVNHIYTNYGSNKSEAFLHIYEEFEYDEELEEQAVEEPTEEKTGAGEEYTEIVSGTITEAKEALNEMEGPDYEAALTAEKENKNRKTLVNWLENQIEA
ncbi:MAG: hypothetical protein ACLFTA_01440 [Candidatus Nanohaloarchaea archaeon]